MRPAGIEKATLLFMLSSRKVYKEVFLPPSHRRRAFCALPYPNSQANQKPGYLAVSWSRGRIWVQLIPNRTFFDTLRGISGLFGLAMGILVRQRLTKYKLLLDLPDKPPKRTKKLRLGVKNLQFKNNNRSTIKKEIPDSTYLQYVLGNVMT